MNIVQAAFFDELEKLATFIPPTQPPLHPYADRRSRRDIGDAMTSNAQRNMSNLEAHVDNSKAVRTASLPADFRDDVSVFPRDKSTRVWERPANNIAPMDASRWKPNQPAPENPFIYSQTGRDYHQTSITPRFIPSGKMAGQPIPLSAARVAENRATAAHAAGSSPAQVAEMAGIQRRIQARRMKPPGWVRPGAR